MYTKKIHSTSTFQDSIIRLSKWLMPQLWQSSRHLQFIIILERLWKWTFFNNSDNYLAGTNLGFWGFGKFTRSWYNVLSTTPVWCMANRSVLLEFGSDVVTSYTFKLWRQKIAKHVYEAIQINGHNLTSWIHKKVRVSSPSWLIPIQIVTCEEWKCVWYFKRGLSNTENFVYLHIYLGKSESTSKKSEGFQAYEKKNLTLIGNIVPSSFELIVLHMARGSVRSFALSYFYPKKFFEWAIEDYC